MCVTCTTTEVFIMGSTSPRLNSNRGISSCELRPSPQVYIDSNYNVHVYVYNYKCIFLLSHIYNTYTSSIIITETECYSGSRESDRLPY